MNQKYVVLDFETTGHSPKKKDKIIQIGLVVVQNGTIIDRYSSYLNPGIPIPSFISSLTGIKQSTVEDAPTFEEVAPELLKLLDGACLVAHNIQFDLSFLNAELENAGYFEWRGMLIDTVELSRILMPNLDSYKLSQLSDSLALEHLQPHKADSDAEATGLLLIELLNRLETLPLLTLQRLHPLLKGLHSDVAGLVQECINRKLGKLEEDIPELDVYRQLILRKMKERGLEEEYVDESLTHQDIQERFADSLPNYEKRYGQLEMMDVVGESLTDGRHAMIEAGTGIGKSLGYLIPGLLHAKKTGRPLVVSTHTIQLQEQLLDRDIPLLKQMVPFDFNASVLKGRNHYLCLRKFEQQLDQIYDNNYDVLLAKAQLLVWLTTTDEGDIEELNLPSGGQLFWHQVKSDANSCLNHKCPWFSRCFYHRSKREAYDADIIITNHALLFTDLVNDHALIPAYQEVVIDEAHHLDEVAGDHFGLQTDYFSFHRVLDRLGTSEEKTVNLWLKLEEILNSVEIDYDKSKVINGLKDMKFEIDHLFSMIKTYVVAKGHKKSEVGKISFRFTTSEADPDWYGEMKEVFARVQLHTNDLLRDCREIIKKVQKHEEHLNVLQKGTLVDYTGLLNKLDEERNILAHMLLTSIEDEVCWIETDPGGARNAVSIYNQPIDISDRLSREFFERKKSVILTSATLTIRNRFDFVRGRLGIGEDAATVQLQSPFDYSNQAKIMVPTDLPMIKDVSTEAYASTIAAYIYRIAYVTDGRMLVLFTSYDLLKKTYHRFKELADPEDFSLIGQGIDSGSRARLTKHFKQLDRAVLFGTSSFWEGVDIPGNDLSCLVIVRLPFNPPDNPVIEARSEQIRRMGKSPFMELSLPQAIIRFKQGFGRLVRSSSDHGAVFVFDRRIVTAKYGKMFLSSLPDVPVLEGSMDDLLDDLKYFIG
ncbi:ATP-dependent DNA helicase DinG [Pseudalkalibacillus salsuginis]|uniref:ATP-dependent DNA helicase DinG n=1 Tax=Pseudalkalibacillus salsuginis TaxID=2910972 RepID=UPI001F31C321|nr:ATP-dependent DNA helicase DinG [Pseudalkalibacillus salsuginis]MCF6408205.1 ATP-dependent DNA helicase DinG [Pseudalkalibacillus salsuginis]